MRAAALAMIDVPGIRSRWQCNGESVGEVKEENPAGQVKEVEDAHIREQHAGQTSTQERIFVSVISYRDSELPNTLRSMFEQASAPERVFVGLCAQYDLDKEKEWYTRTHRPEQVRTLLLPHTMARGPCFARALAQTLWEGEEYFLQIDSHMRFGANWDVTLVDMLAKCPSAKPILTTYPTAYELGADAEQVPTDMEPLVLCAKQFQAKDGMLRIHGRRLKKCPEVPLPGLFWAAGFTFSHSRVIQEVPYDACLKNVFFGEESSMAARLWTHGWDFFTPCINVIWHLWSREHRPSFREVAGAGGALERYSTQRVCSMLGMPARGASAERREVVSMREGTSPAAKKRVRRVRRKKPLRRRRHTRQPRSRAEAAHWGCYGLGRQRSLLAFQRWCGVDFAAGTINDHGRCGGLAEAVFKVEQSNDDLALIMGLLAQRNLSA